MLGGSVIAGSPKLSTMTEPSRFKQMMIKGVVDWNCRVARRQRRKHAPCIDAAKVEGILPPAVVVRETGDARGRGVFALRAFRSGECVEICPVVPVSGLHEHLPKELQERAFNWGHLTDARGQQSAIALGYGSLYNHANPANLRYIADRETKCLIFIAARAIKGGDEFTINYNAASGGPKSLRDDWFTHHDITPLKPSRSRRSEEQG